MAWQPEDQEKNSIYALRVLAKAGTGTPERLGIGKVYLDLLRSAGCVGRSAAGLYSITLKGVTWLEDHGGQWR